MTRFLALTLLISFFAFLPNAFADGDNGLHITPADSPQTASNGTAILTLKATNIQVRAKWRLDGDSPFTITYHGELRLTATLSDPDTIVATVIVEDMFSELNSGYQNLAATALITVEFIHKLRIINLPTNMLFAVSGIGKILHTFQTSGGKSAPTFSIVPASSDFYLDESDGVLSVGADAAAGIYTLTVQTSDTATTLQITATVAVVETLFLADAPPLTATVINATVSLHTFTASGGLGTLTYALIGDNTLHFSIDERDGVLRIDETATVGIYTLSVEVSDGVIIPQKATAVATVTVVETLFLADAPPLTATAGAAASLHTFTASGGWGAKTYTLIGDHTLHFSIDERDGVLRIDETATVGIYTLSVEVADEAIPPQKATAVATVTAEMLEPLILADAPPLTATVINATVSLYTFTASGGLGTLTYALIGDNTLHFSIDERDGVLRIDETATMGIYTLSVEVADEAIPPQEATAVATVTVEMLEPLILADAPPLTVTVINATVSLHTFTASGGLGTLTYALIGDNTLHFSIDEKDGVLWIHETATVGIYTLSVEVSDEAIPPQKATAVATVTVEMLEPLILADAPPLTATVINATLSLHTFTASGGLGAKTYALIGDNTLHFSIDEKGGVLWIDETATVGIYTLSVAVADEAIPPQKATAVATVTVKMLEPLILADAPPLTATVINATVSLHTFTASGGLGAKTYALIGDNTLHFSIDEKDGVLRIDATVTVGIYTLSVEVSDGATNPQRATAMATVTVVETLFLADAPPLTATTRAMVSLHTFTASGGLGTLTYALIGDNTLHFSIDEKDGVLRIDETATVGIYTLSVEVSDGAKIPQKATAVATVTVVETLFLADAPPLTATVINATVSLHTFTASGGLGTLTYALIGDNTLHFSIDERDGVLWIDETATVGIYTLSVEVADEAIPPQKATAVATVTVEMPEPLILADAPPLTVTVINATVSLHTFTASGGLGTLTYALIGDNTLHFSIDERDGVLRIDETATVGIYTLSVEVSDEAIPPQTATAVATVTVVETLFLANAPPLTATVINATVSLHTFTASGGLGTLTYALIGDNTLHFSIDEKDGVLRIDETATVGIYTLSVEVADEAIPPQKATAVATVTLEMLEPLILADAPPLTVTVINATVSLHTFTASGGLGTLTYALIGDNTLHFSIDERDGILRIDETATMGIYTLSVEVADEAIPPQKATAVATVTVEMLEPLILADAPPLTATVINATVSLHTFTASGGLGTLTYALIGDNTLHFSIDERDGILRIDETATMGIYTLSVEVADEAIPPQKATAVATVTVEMLEPLILSDAPPLTVTVINATVSLHTFTASGGLGTLTYALIGDNTLHFSIDERDGILRIDETATMGIYTLSVEVSDGARIPQRATAMATVTVVETLFLADAPPLTATVINATVSLHTFTASGGLGAKTYALIAGNTDYFSIGHNNGVLQMNSEAKEGIYTLSVEVSDGAMTPQKATAVATVTVEMLEPLILADAPPLTATVINATVSLHTFTASGGLGAKTYTLIGDNTLHFSIDEKDGVLRIHETATVGIYTLSVEVADEAIPPQKATAVATVTVEMLEPLILADAPPLTATVINATVSLHTFTASGGFGTLTYALIGDNTLHFSIDERDGVLRIDETATMGIYTLSVEVADEAIPPQKATAVATVTVEMLEPLILADAPPLTVTVINATVSLHTFTASGGLGTLTYALIGDNTLHFSIDERDGVLRIDETATMGIYTLSVEVADEAIPPQKATAMATVTVKMLEPLILADAPPLTVTVINATVSLHTFTASGGLGTLTYALIGDNTLHFSIDERDGVLRIDETATMGIYTLSVEVSDGAKIPQTATAVATVTVVETLFLADAPPLTVTVINATVSLHTFTASGGLGTLTYALIGDNTLHFSIDERDGVLRIDETATMGIYTLSVEVSDGAKIPQTATAVATVTVVETLFLADAPPLTATVINATVSLHTFTASGGLGTLTYALIGDNTLHFSIDEKDGVLRIDETATVGIYTLSVEVSDGAMTPQKATAVATVTVEMLEPLILADAPPLTVTVINATVSLHTFTASGGLGTLTYALIGDNTLHFSIDERDGVLRIDETATMGIYTLSVEVADEAIPPQKATAVATVTVEMLEPLILADAPPLTVTVINATVSLHTFTASGGLGTLTYALIGDNTLHFSIDERDGVLRIDETATMGIYTLSVEVSDGAKIPQTATAVATVTVVETLFLADAPPLTATVINATVSLHTFTASGGLGTLTYALIGDNTLHFSIDERDGVLRIDETATMGIYTLSVEVADEAMPPQKATAVATVTVKMIEPLILADAPPLTATTRAMVSLHTFTASGGFGTLTYVLIGDNTLHFSIDEKDGVLWIHETATMGIYTLSVEVADGTIRPQEATAVATVTVDGKLRIINPPANILFAASGMGMVLHTFQTSGGESAPTFRLYPANSYFYLDELGGVLSVRADAAMGIYMLTVQISDTAITLQITATVEVVEALTLKAKVSYRSRDLHVFNVPYASAYSIVAGPDDGYFEIGKTSGVLKMKAWTPAGNYPLGIGIIYTFSLGIPPKVVVSAVVVEITDYPTTQSKIYVLGGHSHHETGSDYRNDVWSSVNGINWGLITSSVAWARRSEHQALSHNGRLYVLGGYDGGPLNDVWSSADGQNWSQETAHAEWTPRYSHQALSHNGRLYVLGGRRDNNSNNYLNDVWSSADGQNWSLETAGARWKKRYEHQALSHNGRLYVLGGYEKNDPFILNDVWSSANGKNWSRETAPPWTPRYEHQALSHNGRLYVLGGHIGSSPFRLNDVWSSVDGKNWSLENANAEWTLRYSHQALSHNGRLYVLGGEDDKPPHFLNDVWSSADGKNWVRETNDAKWSDRHAHQAAVFPSPLVLFGVGEKIIITAGIAANNLHSFTVANGTGNYAYSLEPAVDGFAVSSDGVLSADGTAMAGAYTINVFVVDEEDNRGQTAVRVNAIRLSLSFLDASEEWILQLPVGHEGVLHTLTASGGYGDHTYTLSPPGSGFVIDANGVLSADGTATPGEHTITVEVADELNSKTATWSGKVIIISAAK